MTDKGHQTNTCVIFFFALLQDSMIRILLIWSRIHPNHGYHQAMSDLLAVILVLLQQERQLINQLASSFGIWPGATIGVDSSHLGV